MLSRIINYYSLIFANSTALYKTFWFILLCEINKSKYCPKAFLMQFSYRGSSKLSVLICIFIFYTINILVILWITQCVFLKLNIVGCIKYFYSCGILLFVILLVCSSMETNVCIISKYRTTTHYDARFNPITNLVNIPLNT